MKVNENKKGISLIVLIITILVMIILAAVIILNLDDTKIISNAERATTANNLAAAKEIRVVAKAEWRVNEAKLRKEGHNSFESYLNTKIDEAGLDNIVVISSNGEIVLVPNGFVASSVDTENEVSEGLVIYEGTEPVTKENIETAQTTRNQYVWVPVKNKNEFIKKEWGVGEIVEKYNSYNINDATEELEYNAMRESVAKYGGFYIARYEAGKEGTSVNTMASKKNAKAWSGVVRDFAKKICETLSTDTVVSHLIYGEEWDAALTFISKTDSTYVLDATGKGWYSNNYKSGNPNLLTGMDVDQNKSNMVCNIYDMAGNVSEWTMEAYPTSNVNLPEPYGCIRGSSRSTSDTDRGAARRYTIYSTNTNSLGCGFRSALYLK